jgi:hypothetical protein
MSRRRARRPLDTKERTMRIRPIALLTMMLALGAVTTSAQDQQQRVGLTMGYPASVGIIWHVTDKVAVRPDLSFLHTSNELAAPISAFAATTSSDVTTVSIGVSGLFYVGKWDALRAYLSPRFAYSRLSGSNSVTSSIGVGDVLPAIDVSSTVSNYLVSGSFGAQYSLGRRFGVFGEVGYGYTRASDDTRALSTTRSTTTGTRTGVGVIFYF